jgi:formylglycine-generating enzyme required for sulfatase activity
MERQNRTRPGRVTLAGLVLVVAASLFASCGADEGASDDAAAGADLASDTVSDVGWAEGGCGADCAARVTIEGGTLLMGCTDGTNEECMAEEFFEVPAHEVTVASFEIDRYETTVARFEECVDAGACVATDFDSIYCNRGKLGRDEHPINCIDWDQARAFCGWAGGRLCAEAEWEWAARGAEGRKWPWGDEVATCERAVMSQGGYGCGQDSTQPVGARPLGATPEGLLDMAGNVWEWLEDSGDGGGAMLYEGAPTDGSAWIDQEGSSDRVVRGGGFPNDAKTLIAWRRYNLDRTNYATYYTGVRCCRSK